MTQAAARSKLQEARVGYVFIKRAMFETDVRFQVIVKGMQGGAERQAIVEARPKKAGSAT